jgi:hypothetical protein
VNLSLLAAGREKRIFELWQQQVQFDENYFDWFSAHR